jgi:hypothetical protein
MKQCPSCGIEVDGEPEVCPLCRFSFVDREDVSHDEPSADQSVEVSARERARLWLWEIFTIVILATAIIIATSDFAYGFDVSWSAYPLSALAFVWLSVSSIVALRRFMPLAYAAETTIVLAYLLVLDVLTPGDPWYLSFALPIGLLVSVIIGAAAVTVRGLKISVFPMLAISLIYVGIFLLGLETIISFALSLDSVVSWSIVGFGGCLSISLLLWLINRRLRERHADFKRLFHL